MSQSLSDLSDFLETSNSVQAWVKETQGKLRDAVPVRTGTLRKSLRFRVRNDNYRQKIIITFQFERYGAWLAKGARKGYAGNVGSVWYTKDGQRRTTNPASFGKMGRGKSVARDWLTATLESQEKELKDIVGAVFESVTLKALNIK